jgi:hypothetical protein
MQCRLTFFFISYVKNREEREETRGRMFHRSSGSDETTEGSTEEMSSGTGDVNAEPKRAGILLSDGI